MLCGLGWVLEEEAGQVVPLGYCDLSHRAFLGEGARQVMGGAGYCPSSTVLPSPLTAICAGCTLFVYNILFWPACFSASAESDKTWLSW